ncbi:MAG: META domain-containing protein [Caldilineales bacterium]
MRNYFVYAVLMMVSDFARIVATGSVFINDDGTVEIQADCNNASGAYTYDGMSVNIEVGPATLAACPGDSRS